MFYGCVPNSKALTIRDRQGFLDSIREDSAKALALGPTATFGFVDVAPGIQVNEFRGMQDYMTAVRERMWAAAAAIDVIANEVLATEMKVVPRDPKKVKKGLEPRVNNALLQLLQNPNQYDTMAEMLYLWVGHMESCGNAYWFKDQMNGFGQPLALYTLNPKNVVIVPDRVTKIKGYIYRANGAEIEFSPDEIIHFKRPDIDHPLLGIGTVRNGTTLFDEYINRALHSKRVFANGATPSGVLVREDFKGSQEDWDKTKAAFQEKYGGQNNAGKIAWLNGKWSRLQLGMSAADMQDLERTTKTEEDVFKLFRVPLSVAGYGSANYATANREERNFRRYKIRPLIKMLVDAINSPRGLIPAFHKDMMLQANVTGMLDVEQVAKENAPLFDRGCLTPNDLRELCGHKRVDNPMLDQYFVSSTLVPIEIAGVVEPIAGPPANVPPGEDGEDWEDGEPKPKPGEKPKPGKPGGERPDSADVEQNGHKPTKPAKQ